MKKVIIGLAVAGVLGTFSVDDALCWGAKKGGSDASTMSYVFSQPKVDTKGLTALVKQISSVEKTFLVLASEIDKYNFDCTTYTTQNSLEFSAALKLVINSFAVYINMCNRAIAAFTSGLTLISKSKVQGDANMVNGLKYLNSAADMAELCTRACLTLLHSSLQSFMKLDPSASKNNTGAIFGAISKAAQDKTINKGTLTNAKQVISGIPLNEGTPVFDAANKFSSAMSKAFDVLSYFPQIVVALSPLYNMREIKNAESNFDAVRALAEQIMETEPAANQPTANESVASQGSESTQTTKKHRHHRHHHSNKTKEPVNANSAEKEASNSTEPVNTDSAQASQEAAREPLSRTQGQPVVSTTDSAQASQEAARKPLSRMQSHPVLKRENASLD